ncbi:unnamed protein product [Linum tenue]|nr:unnamed protein product [Linum tenue]CAI0469558.1 unnamed protein product [Linum tenue]
MVGKAGKRIVIRADHLNHPVLRQLLDQAYEENGWNNDGLLAIPCDEPSFRDIIHSLTVGDEISSSRTRHQRNPGVQISDGLEASPS